MTLTAGDRHRQVEEPGFSIEEYVISSPRNDHDQQNDVAAPIDSLSNNSLQLQVTTAPESFEAVAKVIQYDSIEPDPQVATAQLTEAHMDSPTLKDTVEMNAMDQFATIVTEAKHDQPNFLQRLHDTQPSDAVQGFKFQAASKPVAGQYGRPAPRFGAYTSSASSLLAIQDLNKGTAKSYPTSNESTQDAYRDNQQGKIVAIDKVNLPGFLPTLNLNHTSTILPSAETVVQQVEPVKAPTVKNAFQPLVSTICNHGQSNTLSEVSAKPFKEVHTWDCAQPGYQSYGLHNPDPFTKFPPSPVAIVDQVDISTPPTDRSSLTDSAERRFSAPSTDIFCDKSMLQLGLELEVNIPCPSQIAQRKKNTTSRNIIQMPFPEAARTSSRHRKQGKYLLGGVQQVEQTKLQIISVDHQQSPLQVVAPNSKQARTSDVGTEGSASGVQLRCSTSNSSVARCEEEYNQCQNTFSTSTQIRDFIKDVPISDPHTTSLIIDTPKTDVNQRLSSISSRRDKQSKILELSRSQMMMQGQDFVRNSAQVIDRDRSSLRDVNMNKSVALQLQPNFKCSTLEEYEIPVVSSEQTAELLQQSSLIVNSSRELLEASRRPQKIQNDDVDQPADNFQNVQNDLLVSDTQFLMDLSSKRDSISDLINTPYDSHPSKSRVSSPARSEFQSRPPSRRSNCGITITRPLSAKNIQPACTSDSRVLQSGGPSKITKFHNGTKQQTPTHGVFHKQQPIIASELMSDYHKFMANGAQYCEILSDYERQRTLVEAQKSEINQLKASNQSSKQELVDLHAEKVELDEKIKKLTDLSSKYKKHMNDVVKSQKVLKVQGIDLQKTAKEAVAAYSLTQSMLQKIRDGVREMKELRAPIETLAVQKNKALAELNDRLSTKNKELREALEDAEEKKRKLISENIEVVSENEKLLVCQERLHREKDIYFAEILQTLQYNESLTERIKAGERENDLLSQDLDKCMTELGREKHSVEKLQDIARAQVTAHKELVDLLKQAPAGVVGELSKDEGILVKMVSSVNATQEKIYEATHLMNSLKSHRLEPPESLTKLIENFFSRLEADTESLNKNRSVDQETMTKLMEDLKKGIDQLRFEKKTEDLLNDRINEMHQSNRRLIAERVSLERDTQNMTKQLDEVNKDLADCRDQLRTKSNELAVALAVLPEVPLLGAQVQCLESTNRELQNHLESASRDITKLEEEIESVNESSTRHAQKVEELEFMYDVAQTKIKNYHEEKCKYIAEKAQEIEIIRQNLKETFGAQEVALKSDFEKEVRKIDQKYKEKEVELVSAQDELGRVKELMNETNDVIRKLNQNQKNTEAEVHCTREEIRKLQEANITLENTSKDLSRKHEEQEAELISAREELKTLRDTTDSTKIIDERHKAIKAELDSVIEEKKRLLEENSILIDTIKKHQAALACFQVNFAQQAMHLKQLKQYHPGRQEFEGFQGFLQLTRNEISELGNELRFMENANAQNVDALMRVQSRIESRLLDIDVLEKERDAAQTQVTVLQEEVEKQKDAISNIRPPAHRAGDCEEFITHEKPTPLPEASLEHESTFNVNHINTPEAKFSLAIREPVSGLATRHISASQNQTTPVQQTLPTISSSNRVATGSTSSLQQIAPLNPRSLRPAARKISKLGVLQRSQNEVLQPLPEQPSHASRRQVLTRNDYKRPNSVSRESQVGRCPEVSLDLALCFDDESSSLTDSDAILDRLENYDEYRSLQMEHAPLGCGDLYSTGTQSRSSKFATKESASISKQSFKRSRMQPEDVSPGDANTTPLMQPPRKRVKIGVLKAPSIEEESRKRRQSGPIKSAMKITGKEIKGQQYMSEDQSQSIQPVRSAPAASRRSNFRTVIQDRGPAAFKGYVGGKTAKTTLMASLQMNDHKNVDSSAGSLTHKYLLPGQNSSSDNVQGRRRSVLRTAPARRLSIAVIADSQGSQ